MGELIEQRKIIVIRLPFDTLTTPVTRMIAQLFMAQITLAILARDVENIDQYHPAHVFVDEAQHVASPATATAIGLLSLKHFSKYLRHHLSPNAPEIFDFRQRRVVQVSSKVL